jgi:hypothetical protein
MAWETGLLEMPRAKVSASEYRSRCWRTRRSVLEEEPRRSAGIFTMASDRPPAVQTSPVTTLIGERDHDWLSDRRAMFGMNVPLSSVNARIANANTLLRLGGLSLALGGILGPFGHLVFHLFHGLVAADSDPDSNAVPVRRLPWQGSSVTGRNLEVLPRRSRP